MHEFGSHAKLAILHADGEVDVIHDAPFAFDSQDSHFFDPPITVKSTDQLRATCEFTNQGDFDVMFGEGTNEEMCYLFVTAYPIGSLSNGRNGCAGPFCVPGGTLRCIDNENILDAVGGL